MRCRCCYLRSQQGSNDEKLPLYQQAGSQQMEVTVPEGYAGGSQIQVQTPSGLMAVQVPQGLGPGQKFQMTDPPPVAGV